MSVSVFDDRACALGEGPLWHPLRNQLFWFDILGQKLLSRDDAGPQTWQFDEIVSAAGWVDETSLLIASETRLFHFDLKTGASETIVPLEADNPANRSNDGRADPFGGFWIGTMGKSAEPGAGAIYRFFRGDLRKLHTGISVSNAICFAPGGSHAYFSDTLSGQIMRQPLDDLGWPAGPAEVWLDLRKDKLNPDGAVIDARGNLWNAQWGAGRVAQYAPDGTFLSAIDVPAAHASCPAFGGQDLTTLFCTSAQEHLSAADIAANPAHGQTFVCEGHGPGLPEPRVLL